jgi:hypothetical protein
MPTGIIRTGVLALLISAPLQALAQGTVLAVPLTAPSQTGLPDGFAAALCRNAHPARPGR